MSKILLLHCLLYSTLLKQPCMPAHMCLFANLIENNTKSGTLYLDTKLELLHAQPPTMITVLRCPWRPGWISHVLHSP